MTTKPDRPGEILRYRLELLGINQSAFADIIGRNQSWVSDVVHGKKSLTVEAAAHIGEALGTGPGYWLLAQDKYRLWELSQKEEHLKRLEGIRERAKARGL